VEGNSPVTRTNSSERSQMSAWAERDAYYFITSVTQLASASVEDG
jgi:hypothetical protein